jgi:hypothetical protein
MLYPDEPADREFVAATAMRALGYVSAPEQEIGDIDDCREPEIVNIAVASGLFPLDDNGDFDPRGEADEALIAAAAAAARADSAPPELDPEHVDSYGLNPAVVDLKSMPGVS